jgi:hypothetical protein
MKDEVALAVIQKKYLYLVMDIFETNLQALFKELRKEKKKLTAVQIKIMAFQLFKALYYLKVMLISKKGKKSLPPRHQASKHSD